MGLFGKKEEIPRIEQLKQFLDVREHYAMITSEDLEITVDDLEILRKEGWELIAAYGRNYEADKFFFKKVK